MRRERYTFEEWDGEKRLPEDYRPDWPKEEITHFQMYEDVTEGTPVSPVFATREELARWLANNLDDDRYPYTSIKWLQILTSDHPAVELIIEVPATGRLN